tara:strand:+ start:285 stop:1139 length:855 start_codon:yes stop_codon:yes gene_type:complete
MDEKLNLSKVEFSNNDIKLGIKVPTHLTEDLAYFLGFHVGDGHMNIQRRKHAVDYRLQYDGHQINEKVWYVNFIKPLIFKLFNKNLAVKFPKDSTVQIYFRSKAVLTFLHNCCGINLGRKTEMGVPLIIYNSSNNVKSSFLRGLADTDFSLVFKKGGKYPVISHNTSSEVLHKDLCIMLQDFGFKFYSATGFNKRKNKTHLTHQIQINGRKALQNWLNLIGYSSYNTITRYLVWKETGFLSPGTDINDRIKILKEKGNKFPFNVPGRIRTDDRVVSSELSNKVH